MRHLSFLLLALCLVFGACRKAAYVGNPKNGLAFGTDTLVFDTVFTGIGSATRSFVVHNPNSQGIKIAEIFLAGKRATGKSQFRLNINGKPQNSDTQVELDANDSLYIFAEVTVDPTAATSPFVIRDSIGFTLNGKTTYVQLNAFGQDVHLFAGQAYPYYDSIRTDTTWPADKPYLIYNSLKICPGATLTIEPGARIYSTRYSLIYVQGTLNVQGACDTAKRVLFTSDRLDPYYRDLPSGWIGLYFAKNSTNNVLENVEIRNALAAVRVDSLPASGAYNLVLRNARIHNCGYLGVRGRSANIRMDNTLIYDCANYTFVAEVGGTYDLNHCTLANNADRFGHKDAGVSLSNKEVYDANNVARVAGLHVRLLNTILWGLQTEEIALDSSAKIPNTAFDVQFDHALVTTKSGLRGVGILRNANPLFQNTAKGLFRPNAASLALGAGIPTPLTEDLICRPYKPAPALGAIEGE